MVLCSPQIIKIKFSDIHPLYLTNAWQVAIAGAPVTSWNLYDTGYTERYMGQPQTNIQGYKGGSVLSYINQFPDQ